MCSLPTNMSVRKILSTTVVKIDGTGVVKSSKFENDETIYDVEIERIDIWLPFFSISA